MADERGAAPRDGGSRHTPRHNRVVEPVAADSVFSHTPSVSRLAFGAAVLAVLSVSLSLASAGARGSRAGLESSRILYVSSWSGSSQVYVVDPSGRAARGQVTFASAQGGCDGVMACGAEDPVASPNGRQVAYVLTGRESSLHVVRADGSSDRIVDAHVPECHVPVWSADSRHVSFSCGGAGPRSPDGNWTLNSDGPDIVVARTSGRTSRVIHAARSPAWSPDGRSLAYVGAGGILVLDLRTGRTRRWSRDVGFGLAWSPDGTQLAYLHGRGPGNIDSQAPMTGDLRVVTRFGRVRVVVSAAGAYGGPILSFAWTRVPDGLRYRTPARVDGLYAGWFVTQLAADGGRVAYSTCDGVSVWAPPSDVGVGVVRPEELGVAGNCDPFRNYLGVFSLALVDDRVAFSTAYGGNTTVWRVGGAVLAATPQGFQLESGQNTCCLTNPEVGGAGGLLVFDSRAEQEHGSVLGWQIRRAGPSGCPCPSINDFQHPTAGEVHIDDVDANRIVVDRPDYLRILDADGATLLALPVHTPEAVFSGDDLIVHVGSELRDYDSSTGVLWRTWQPPGLQPPTAQPRRDPAARVLQDAARGLVAYILNDQIHLLRLDDGQDATVAPGTLARFMDTGLVYADGARIHLVPYDQLPLR
jgi:hypothetical protein